MFTIRRVFGVLMLGLTLLLSGCFTRVESGEIALRRAFSGDIKQEVLQPGLHQTFWGDVIIFSSKEIMLNEEDIRAQTAEKSTLQDFDLSFSYDFKDDALYHIYTSYSPSNHLSSQDKHEIYPMATFMKNLVRSAAYSAVGAIPALEVNQEKNRQAITDAIRANVLRKLQDEKLEGILTLKSVLIRNLQPAKEIVDSATAVVTRQNELAAKKTEVSIAEEEAKRIAMLNSNSKAIEYMNAQATMEIAKAMREGKVHAVVVPYDFKGIVNVPAK